MGDIVRFVPKSELERARLIREARAIYDSIFPPAVCARQGAAGRRGARQDLIAAAPGSAHGQKQNAR
ncbi:hypothetical protein [Bradyrhizobium sp. CB2312]|uniref:hypothetical protein n=1 Tax=Bradyrhizobium sp. CB2312 TaxID=3039155 RepID=UPI0024B1F044|nr:hypothetical protein [Bradyrhizobium sp. CB2312]WFU68675.1 hypothetical protein QA642_25475 [Bradyrhizobium sp. CB2312]